MGEPLFLKGKSQQPAGAPSILLPAARAELDLIQPEGQRVRPVQAKILNKILRGNAFGLNVAR